MFIHKRFKLFKGASVKIKAPVNQVTEAMANEVREGFPRSIKKSLRQAAR